MIVTVGAGGGGGVVGAFTVTVVLAVAVPPCACYGDRVRRRLRRRNVLRAAWLYRTNIVVDLR